MLSFERFEAAVRACYATIPEEFVRRVTGPVVVPDTRPHPDLAGNYLLGECVHAPDFTGVDELYSTVYLYYGSFVRVADEDPDFDVLEEIRETVLHEVQHHVEDAAGGTRLAADDFVGEQHERMRQGLDFVDHYWRRGDAVPGHGDRLWAVGRDLVLELPLSVREWRHAQSDGVVLTVRGRRVVIGPGELGSEPELLGYPGYGGREGGELGDLILDVRPKGRLHEDPR